MDKDLEFIKLEQKEIKEEQKIMKKEILTLQISDQLQNKEIENVKGVLADIKEDTRFIKRSVQGAVISAVVGIIIALVWASIKN